MNHSLYFPANDQRHDKGHSGNGTDTPPEMSPAGCFCLRTPGRALSPARENPSAITLPEEALPGGEYSLDRSDDYILALSNPASMNEPFGAVYYTDSGTVCLANLTLFDRQGNPVRQYPRSQVYGYDENDQKICLLPCPEGEEVAEVYGLGGAMPIYWLGRSWTI